MKTVTAKLTKDGWVVRLKDAGEWAKIAETYSPSALRVLLDNAQGGELTLDVVDEP